MCFSCPTVWLQSFLINPESCVFVPSQATTYIPYLPWTGWAVCQISRSFQGAEMFRTRPSDLEILLLQSVRILDRQSLAYHCQLSGHCSSISVYQVSQRTTQQLFLVQSICESHTRPFRLSWTAGVLEGSFGQDGRIKVRFKEVPKNKGRCRLSTSWDVWEGGQVYHLSREKPARSS